MPEYLSKRFGGTRLQIYLTIVCLATYLFGNLSVSKKNTTYCSSKCFVWIIILFNSLISLCNILYLKGAISDFGK